MKSEHRRTDDEWDAFSHWGRQYLCYLQRPGVTKAVKRRSHRKDRHNARLAIRSGRLDRL